MRYMKKVVCFIMAVVLCLTLIGCTDTSEGATSIESRYCHMVVVEKTHGGMILQDSDTGVLYLWYKNDNIYGQTLTPLYNADGTLKNISDYSCIKD